ncbi:MAG: hypothetical protein Q7R47_05325 [Candidatus Diapherotrites archaeon]|nr:hypothetical protein [Candidatus Diapherotrites archaeon]
MKNALAIGVLLLLALVAIPVHVQAAVSASDAVIFVSEDNHFLEKNDSIEQPTVPIIHATKKYWVIPVLHGTDVATFIPIPLSELSVSDSQPVNEQLYSTAQFLRSYLIYKNGLAAQNKKWFLGSDNQLIIADLATGLTDSIYRLNIVKSDFSEGANDITTMQNQLSSMSQTSGELSQAIFEFVQAENQFVSEPDTGKISAIQDHQQAANEKLFGLETQARDYQSKVLNLKLKISKSTLPADKKNNYIKLVDAPPALYTIGSTSIGNWVILANESQTQVQGLYTQAKSKDFLDTSNEGFSERNNQNKTYAALFGLDDDFKTKTRYASLDTAIKDITAEDKKNTWKNQEQLQLAADNWQKAIDAYNNRQYDIATALAAKSKNNVQRVIADGLIDQTPPNPAYQNLITIAIGVVVLIILLYFLKNRGKIIGALARPQESADPGVEVNAWKRY